MNLGTCYSWCAFLLTQKLLQNLWLMSSYFHTCSNLSSNEVFCQVLTTLLGTNLYFIEFRLGSTLKYQKKNSTFESTSFLFAWWNDFLIPTKTWFIVLLDYSWRNFRFFIYVFQTTGLMELPRFVNYPKLFYFTQMRIMTNHGFFILWKLFHVWTSLYLILTRSRLSLFFAYSLDPLKYLYSNL